MLDDWLTDPDSAAMLARVNATLKTESYNSQLIAWVGQTQRKPAYWPPHQVVALAHVLEGLAYGRIVRRRIPLGETPGPDADREGNATRLRSLAAPFKARLDMTQNGADSDGEFAWDLPINLWRALGVRLLGQEGIHGSVHAPFQARPSSVPLEVGYTLPSRTMAHLMMEGAVARWAYEDDEICLLLDLGRIGAWVGTRPLPGGVEEFTLGL